MPDAVSDLARNLHFLKWGRRLQDFFELAPHKFQNKTNGVTPRRWLAWCNPGLAALITETLGTDAWPNDLNLLTGLRQYADDKDFQKKWRAIKNENKARLAAKIKVHSVLLAPLAFSAEDLLCPLGLSAEGLLCFESASQRSSLDHETWRTCL